ncbi:TetR/AcrR family transcriptional regulator [Sporohalobacter salinus]|uniref:TetR/AcrR family transcriptional regulator n=1 Tax=Sporohalobacter salinus TaxID=1494606 RepID=UPI00195FFDB7|nr:TetR/AcrR family transcriptional regulator [Sporohalobacter salinus]MBM7624516.1 AcrR family transcriptional regulator [Sporohalobacter salinus]
MNAKSKKEKLIQSAIEKFSQQGYHQTSVSEIADRAGVAKGTVYWYFDSKKELFWNIILSDVEKINNYILTKVNEGNEGAIKKLRQVIRLHLNFFKDRKDVARMIKESSVTSDSYFHKRIDSLRTEAINNISKIIKTGQENGEFITNIDSKELANFILGSINSYNPVVYELEDVEQKVDLITNIILNGIKQ